MEDGVGTRLDLALPCDNLAPAAARRALIERAALDWIHGDLLLVVSELVTNAVMHSGGAARDEIGVSVAFTERIAQVEVRDPGHSGSVAEPSGRRAPYGGFGLRLIEQLSSRWGACRAADGRHTVWAEVPLRPRPRPRASRRTL